MADAPPSEKLSADELALVKAAAAGDLQQVKKLLAKGASPDVRDSETHTLGLEWNVTPLMCAAAHGHLEVVRSLLEAGASVAAASDAHKEDGGGGSQALHHAVAGKNVAIIEALLDAGADPNVVGRYGRTPLTVAVRELFPEGVRSLLKRGANVNLKARRKDYEPPLWAAASVINNTASMVLRNGKMVLEVAALWENKSAILELFNMLLEAGADPNAEGALKSTPLHELARGKEMPDDVRLPIVEALLKAGASPEAVNKLGSTPLETAIRYKNVRLAELLGSAAPK